MDMTDCEKKLSDLLAKVMDEFDLLLKKYSIDDVILLNFDNYQMGLQTPYNLSCHCIGVLTLEWYCQILLLLLRSVL